MNTLISLLIFLLIVGVIFYIVSLIPMPAPFGLIVQIILALIVLLYLLGMLGVVPLNVPRFGSSPGPTWASTLEYRDAPRA